MENFIKTFRKHSEKSPDKTAVIFLQDGFTESATLTYACLHNKAKTIASSLPKENLKGQRIMLLYQAGIEFIASLLGCWYAGAIAVPVSCPNPEDLENASSNINAITEDAGITLILTTQGYQSELKKICNPNISTLATDNIPVNDSLNIKPIPSEKNTIAYLQYTSGSTSAPKGAMVTHGSLAHCIDKTIKAWNYDSASKTLNWAPHTHVYGLVCGLLVPLYHGSTAIIMPTKAFITNPLSWLISISRYQVTHSGCPNFGFDLCVQAIKDEDLNQLDLSHWRVAVNGGDMVQTATIIAFVEKFAPHGFKRESFCSAYGMSELSGLIACNPIGSPPDVVSIPVGDNHQYQIVSSGKFIQGLKAVAVDPKTGLPVQEGETGEIWLSGASVVAGYWQRPEENETQFGQRLPGRDNTYFRTGDLGFIQNNQLYLTGRLKEVMVIYGKKYYPLDFEKTIAQHLLPLNLNLPQVVFSAQVRGQEEIVVVQEIPLQTSQAQQEEILDTIKSALTKTYGVTIYAVVLTKEASIPRTNSGKLQRNKTKLLWQENQLIDLYKPMTSETRANSDNTLTLKSKFINLVGQVLNIPTHQIDLSVPLSRYSFDSLNIIRFASLLNEEFNLTLSPALLYEYATLDDFYQENLNLNQVELPTIDNSTAKDNSTDIAIIGISGIFPKASDLNEFWQNLVAGKDCISEIPKTRWNWKGLTLGFGGFIEGIDEFDCHFFNISPHEAALMDPQQRLFLQTVWRALEDAGYPPASLSDLKTALYVGVFNHDYAELVQAQGITDAYLTTGIMNSMIANRISYLLNFRGPSETIDTACSSSLVAIHHAIGALLHDHCDFAIAGGVNALITPSTYISANEAGMLSPDGRCKTFDKDANGYVRSEGVGALVLKKLSRAKADGDHIYAIIKGSAINHGGHANSLTAPNPNAQAELIEMACLGAGIPVTSLQYIEAHGTGTPLGDPIEINGLKKAFQQLAKKQELQELPSRFCGLGSVKTHIGHLESAAGVAGMIKLLLALKHEMLPGNLHLQTVNPYIDLTDSPFYLVDKNTPWPAPSNSTPRRAGISSFGFGGTNAHVIIEEYLQSNQSQTRYPWSEYLITLSAKTSTALAQKKALLLNWLESQKNPDMASLSYTLNAGRQHFNERYAVIVKTTEELKASLQGESLPESSYPRLSNFLKDYLDGASLDWDKLFGNYKKRISLPVYPFAKESHWLSIQSKTPSALHSLLDENTSGLSGLRFTKQFTGKEWFLKAHQVNEEPVLPGVIGLEMARVASLLLAPNQRIIALKSITWERPLLNQDLKTPVHLNFYPQGLNLAFELTNQDNSKNFVQGVVELSDLPPHQFKTALDLKIIQQSMHQIQSMESIYSYFNQVGLHYGDEFRTIQSIHFDQSTLIAELSLSESLRTNETDFVLHPAMLDGILQTTQALLSQRTTQYLPLAIRQLDIYAPLPPNCQVYAKKISSPDEVMMPEFDIQVIDNLGNTCLMIYGFSLCRRSVLKHLGYYQPHWIESPSTTQKIELSQKALILSLDSKTAKAIEASLSSHLDVSVFALKNFETLTQEQLGDYVILPTDPEESLEQVNQNLEKTFYRTHALIAKILSLKPLKKLEVLCVSTKRSPYTLALAGYAKTLLQEQTTVSCRIVELNNYQELAQELGQHEILVRYDPKTHQRLVQEYQEIASSEHNQSPLLRKNGVYLITGGLGGLGYLFADYLAQTYQANLILTGRSPLNETHQQQIAKLQEKGGVVIYMQADVSSYEEVVHLISNTKERFSHIHGIIHSAGITQDSFITNKTHTGIASVLAPKVQGTCNLHAATLKEPLDFFVLFSSVAAVFGNMGQSDYAYANHFLDDWARVRNELSDLGQCFGHTISINWPLWEEGGLQIDLEFQKLLEKKIGIVSLKTEDGLQALEQALLHPCSNWVVLPGNQSKLHQALAQSRLVKNVSSKLNTSHQEIEQYLKSVISETLKVEEQSIQRDTPFEQYGIDSLMIIQLNQKLELRFKNLPKTLFFEYQNLESLMGYFIENHSEAFKGSVSYLAPDTPTIPRSLSLRTANDDIAIIGIDGQYPQAQNLDEFFENLKAGKDCISEIPRDRWDLQDYFDPSGEVLGKTYSKWGGFLKDIDKFDPLFFNISPREAQLMDPQERLFLQTAWKTLEDAGYAREHLAGKKIGVYVGVMYGQYQLFGQESQYTPTNSVYASIANRVSYYFDFHGPSIAVDTMCSSSLTAIHLACQSLKEGEIELALAGGVNLTLHPNKYLLLSQGQFLSKDGHCHSFGEGGDGYVPGEAVGAVLLKPLSQALADGDRIYGIIKGSQLNHGGKTNGYTVPNPNAQGKLIAEAYQKAGINPEAVSYIEAHGTGTSLGDPIEIAGLNKAFASVKPDNACALGSVKANIGHCESAAGIAALTKVLLQLKHGCLVPSILSEKLNTNIDWSSTPFKVQQTLSPWTQTPKIAGISSFGAGGANAHLIVAEPPLQIVKESSTKPYYLLTLSAKTKLALQQRVLDLFHWLQKYPETRLQDLSYTLNVGRSHFQYREALVVSSIEQALTGLKALSEGERIEPVALMESVQAYLQGETLDFAKLYSGESVRRITLPTYPFAKERYWYNDDSTEQTDFIEDSNPLYNEQITSFIKTQVNQILKLGSHQVDSHRNLDEYGMDSVHFVELSKRIAQHFQIEFTPAVFYTLNSIAAISDYLLKNHPEIQNKYPKHKPPHPKRNEGLTHLKIPLAVKTTSFQKTNQEPIAIIGLHGIFPQSDDLATFWQHLVHQDDLVTEVPQDRWNWRDYYGDESHQTQCKWGGFINQVDQFDAEFFQLSAREVNLMDPQQRLLLESVWKTLEDSGYNPYSLASEKVGVFIGVGFNDYQALMAKSGAESHGLIATGNSHSMIANRVSYYFNFHGPSEAIDTACSSSLVAIHRAINAIRQGECTQAIAGGVSLMLNPETVIVLSQLGALSSDGRCKTFDKSANGYVKGEGVGSLLLKPLSQAQADGDFVYAVIRGSAVNHGGRAKSLTAPNAQAQSELLIQAYENARISPETLGYIETHGTGTALGDPVEIEGLKLAFSKLLSDQSLQPQIALSAVKSNIGHLEPAAGIAGIIKVILSMQHQTIPGVVHLQELNPYINLNSSPFYIAEKTKPWPRLKDSKGQELPLRAGVSSFGFGGSNAHMVLEEGLPYCLKGEESQPKPYYLFTLSARLKETLLKKAEELIKWLDNTNQPISLNALSFTLNVGRAHFNFRYALVVEGIEQLKTALQSLIDSDTTDCGFFNHGQDFVMQGPALDMVYQLVKSKLKDKQQDSEYRKNLFILADLYCKQFAIDWDLLYGGAKINRIPALPAYPFKKQRYWFDTEKPAAIISESQPADSYASMLAYLQNLFAQRLQIPVEKLSPDLTYESFGIDSVIGLDITHRLEKELGPLSKTILYEKNRLSDLAAYLIKNHAPIPQADKPMPKEVIQDITHSIEDIAIIGMSGIFPQAKNLDEFWENLKLGRDCVGTVPEDRWDYRQYPVQIGNEEKVFPYGGFIDDYDQFDPLFFNISPRDAALMDPQERLFMQTVWSALEDAGYTREKLKRLTDNAVGVFAGVTYNYYPVFIAEEWHKGNRVPMDIQTFSIANRISYFLDINGPSLVVDTACSSSLAAIHIACENIRSGQCLMAFAGGVNLSLHPSKYHFLGNFNFMSEEGKCASFAEGGNGYVPAEGVGAVLLKPLKQAIADGDTIHGIIRGSAMNHGGKTSGYTVPNPNAQAQLVSQALRSARIDPRTISYLEAHGTGTSLGDPIEIRGLQEAFSQYTQEKQYCALGSVKSNIGHLESAAGISQLIKVLLQMRHKQLVPTIHAEKVNPFIDFKQSPFYLQRELSTWNPAENAPRRAGISSFGAGGTNVHLIVEEYTAPILAKSSANPPFILILSAQNEARLEEQVRQLKNFLIQHQNQADSDWLASVCYTLQTGREAMKARFAVVASTMEEMIRGLKAYPEVSNLNSHAQHWMQGESIDWIKLYNRETPPLISLPTYPFEKRRCWIPTLEVKPETSRDDEDWLYQTVWIRTPSKATSTTSLKQGKWLIFSDYELGLVLQDHLGRESCLYCFFGDSYQAIDQQVFYVNPEKPEDFVTLMNTVASIEVLGILYLSPPALIETHLALFHTLKALTSQNWKEKLVFALVTQSAQKVIADELIDVDKHPLWSMTRIFAEERPDYLPLLLDLDRQQGLHKNAALIKQELLNRQPGETHIAYRNQVRYTQRLEKAEPREMTAWKVPKAALVTGGLGALGYEVARYLANQGTNYLLLTGTTELTALNQEKTQWLNHLTENGVQVIYTAVDVADKEAMQHVVNKAQSQWDLAIDGVFHLAGVTTDNAPLAEMDATVWKQVLSVKVQGSQVLHELFANRQISSFVLFSSISAVPYFGMAGLSAYAAANEYLSGLALYRRSLGLPAISINWIAWSEKGMSHRHNHDAFLAAVGMDSLGIEQGIALMAEILKRNDEEITVCKIDWNKFLKVNPKSREQDFFKAFNNNFKAETRDMPGNTVQSQEIPELVLKIFAELLDLSTEELDKDAPFENYGLDSIKGIEFIQKLEKHCTQLLSPMDIYRYPTLNQLTNYLSQGYSEPFAVEKSDLGSLDKDQLTQLLEAELQELELEYE